VDVASGFARTGPAEAIEGGDPVGRRPRSGVGSGGKGGDNPAVAEVRVTAAKLDAFRKGIA
jgi:hypothetical protein